MKEKILSILKNNFTGFDYPDFERVALEIESLKEEREENNDCTALLDHSSEAVCLCEECCYKRLMEKEEKDKREGEKTCMNCYDVSPASYNEALKGYEDCPNCSPKQK